MNPEIERTLGRWLYSVRAGERYLAFKDPRAAAPDSIALGSSAFADGAAIPRRYAGRGVGENISPPLHWSNVPPQTKELVLIVQDPDAPMPRPVVHLIATGISPQTTAIPEGALSSHDGSTIDGSAIKLGRGSLGETGYASPRPVRGHGPHRYVFQLFALNRNLTLPEKPGFRSVMTALAGAVLARGKLTGTYEQT
jgi:Raf kinase inhibitor-like YbhB/YbcL family protein